MVAFCFQCFTSKTKTFEFFLDNYLIGLGFGAGEYFWALNSN